MDFKSVFITILVGVSLFCLVISAVGFFFEGEERSKHGIFMSVFYEVVGILGLMVSVAAITSLSQN